jgi:hypothetical protein
MLAITSTYCMKKMEKFMQLNGSNPIIVGAKENK